MGDNSGSREPSPSVSPLTRFDPGRVVQHKTGGPKMVVINKAGEANGFYCQYFDRLGRARTDYFLASNLTDAAA